MFAGIELWLIEEKIIKIYFLEYIYLFLVLKSINRLIIFIGL